MPKAPRYSSPSPVPYAMRCTGESSWILSAKHAPVGDEEVLISVPLEARTAQHIRRRLLVMAHMIVYRIYKCAKFFVLILLKHGCTLCRWLSQLAAIVPSHLHDLDAQVVLDPNWRLHSNLHSPDAQSSASTFPPAPLPTRVTQLRQSHTRRASHRERAATAQTSR